MSNRAYDAKVARRERLNETITPTPELRARDWIIDDLLAADYGATATRSFQNVDRILLRWERPD